MGGVYFCIPVVCGYYVMDWAISHAPTETQIRADQQNKFKLKDKESTYLKGAVESKEDLDKVNSGSTSSNDNLSESEEAVLKDRAVKKQTNTFSDFLKYTTQKEKRRNDQNQNEKK